MAFIAARAGLIGILEGLDVPLLIENRKGMNLLHAACSESNGFKAVQWLLLKLPHRHLIHLFFSMSKRGLTPIEIAAKGGLVHTVERLLSAEGSMQIQWDSDKRSIRLHNRISSSDTYPIEVKILFDEKMRMARFIGFHTAINESFGNVEKVKSYLSTQDWWTPNHEYSRFEHYLNFNSLIIASRGGHFELIEFLLETCKFPTTPVFHWQNHMLNVGILSLSDFAAIGSIPHCEFEADDDNLEATARTNRELIESDRVHFYKHLETNWDGIDLASLSDSGSEKENRFDCIFTEYNVESRVKAIKVLMRNNVSLPRLEILVVHGSFSIFKEFVETGLYDLDALVHQSSMSTPQSIEDCPICLETLSNQMALDCSHVFCDACITKVQEDGNPSVKCPLCRQVSKRVIPFSARLKPFAPWLHISDSPTLKVGQALAGLAAGCDSLFVLKYLVEDKKVDLMQLRFGGETVLHIALRQRAFGSCKWLLKNGFESLLHLPNSDGYSPLQLIMFIGKSDKRINLLFSQYIGSLEEYVDIASDVLVPGLTRSLFLEEVLNSSESTFTRYPENVIAKVKQLNATQKLIELVKNSVPLPDLVEYLKLLVEADEDASWIKAMKELISRFAVYNRTDVLIWLCCNYDLQKISHIVRFTDNLYLGSESMSAFVEELSMIEKSLAAAAKCRDELLEGIENNETLSEINEYQVDYEKLTSSISQWLPANLPIVFTAEDILAKGIEVGNRHIIDSHIRGELGLVPKWGILLRQLITSPCVQPDSFKFALTTMAAIDENMCKSVLSLDFHVELPCELKDAVYFTPDQKLWDIPTLAVLAMETLKSDVWKRCQIVEVLMELYPDLYKNSDVLFCVLWELKSIQEWLSMTYDLVRAGVAVVDNSGTNLCDYILSKCSDDDCVYVLDLFTLLAMERRVDIQFCFWPSVETRDVFEDLRESQKKMFERLNL
ncbi:hypothetical protein BCR33DRAFT_764677 [Rhizoclosmatium globosum]|uniref:RING-type domain-containing protein n=1 Tax=Rhizoclosmatium globosum TaxID=329046 RepID=A0A1Y2CJ37_9FUNG|nr:hypothetical protein BCR33DRAFT_764677 [Rhizoclosmatium globosum]|eukprot:ORY47042.1 hypothetical protein BCR33DRAFT_764677 [Rhizoclosmatium globosum]